MQKILVPTDFSPIADNALQYAINLAAVFKSELHLVHFYHINKVDYNLSYSEDEQPYKKQLERRMNRTKGMFQDQFNQKELIVQTYVTPDSIYALFSDKVITHTINLVVMGSKGASGISKVVFGTVAARVMQIVKVPVLVVPPEHQFFPFRHIVIAIDHKEVVSEVLRPIQILASGFGAKITLLYVHPGSKTNTDQKKDIPMLEGIETTYHEVPISNSITESINKYVKKEGCDLLCMIRREKGLFESIFQKSTTKAQVYNSQVPLLILPEKK